MTTMKTWDSCVSQIVGGNTTEEAQSRFETWLAVPPAPDAAIETEIKKVLATQFVGQLLAEASRLPTGPASARKADAIWRGRQRTEFEQGYWVGLDEGSGPRPTPRTSTPCKRLCPKTFATV